MISSVDQFNLNISIFIFAGSFKEMLFLKIESIGNLNQRFVNKSKGTRLNVKNLNEAVLRFPRKNNKKI